MLEDPWEAPPADAYALTAEPSEAPAAADIQVSFSTGARVTLAGETLEPRSVIEAGLVASLEGGSLAEATSEELRTAHSA